MTVRWHRGARAKTPIFHRQLNRSPNTINSIRRQSGKICQKTCNKYFCTAQVRLRSSSAMTRADGSIKYRGCSKGSFPIWNVAIAKPTAAGSAKSLKAIKTIGPVADVAGFGCDPRRWQSKLPTCTLAMLCRCRLVRLWHGVILCLKI